MRSMRCRLHPTGGHRSGQKNTRSAGLWQAAAAFGLVLEKLLDLVSPATAFRRSPWHQLANFLTALAPGAVARWALSRAPQTRLQEPVPDLLAARSR